MDPKGLLNTKELLQPLMCSQH